MNELRQIIKQQAIRFPSSFVWYSRYRLTSGRRSKAGGHSRHPWCRRSEVSCTIRQRCGDQIVEGAVKGRKKASRGKITWQLHPFTEQYLPPPLPHTPNSPNDSLRGLSASRLSLFTPRSYPAVTGRHKAKLMRKQMYSGSEMQFGAVLSGVCVCVHVCVVRLRYKNRHSQEGAAWNGRRVPSTVRPQTGKKLEMCSRTRQHTSEASVWTTKRSGCQSSRSKLKQRGVGKSDSQRK